MGEIKSEDKFYYEFIDGELFKNIVDILKDTINTANLVFTSNGIAIDVVDGTSISLISFFLEKEMFHKIEIEDKIMIGLHIKTLHLVLKCLKLNDKLSISYEREKMFQIEIHQKGQKYSFSVPLVDVIKEDLVIPVDIISDSKFFLPSSSFARIIHNVSTIGNDITFKSIGKILEIKAKGDLGEVSFIREFEKEHIENSKNMEVTISGRFLSIFSRGKSVSDFIRIGIRENEPIHLYYPIRNKSYLQFFIAPKLEDD